MSSEQLWTSVSKFDSCALDDFRKCQMDFARDEGDHVGIVGVFKEWVKNFKSNRWCEDRFLSFRALRLADEIRRQIRGIMKDVRVPRIQDYEIVEEFKETLGDTETRLRLSLCMGFYMNAAREIELGQAGAYMSVKDNRVLHVDRSSSVSLLGVYPKWLIYTQLLGSNPSHGTIKMLSKVKGKWLRHLVPKLEDLDSDKLLGRISIKRAAEVPETEPEAVENIENKIEQAKARYLKRKGNR